MVLGWTFKKLTKIYKNYQKGSKFFQNITKNHKQQEKSFSSFSSFLQTFFQFQVFTNFVQGSELGKLAPTGD